MAWRVALLAPLAVPRHDAPPLGEGTVTRDRVEGRSGRIELPTPVGETVVVRIWGCRVRQGREAAYLAFLEDIMLPEISGVAGNLGVKVLRGVDGDEDRFLVLSAWADLEAVKAFTGSDRDRAVVPAEARRLLADFDTHVRHFVVASEAGRW